MRTSIAVNALGKPQGRSLAVDDTYVYFNHSNRLVRVPKTATNASTYEDIGEDEVNAVVRVGDTFFYTTDHSVARVPVAGGTTTLLAEELGALNDIAVCGDSVFVVDYGDGPSVKKRLLRIPARGGPAVELVEPYAGTSTGALACDGEHVYYSAQTSQVMNRVPVGGGAAEEFACQGGYQAAIDHSALYWVDYNSNIIDALAK